MGIDATDPRGDWSIHVGIEMNDLRQCMHPRVGTTSTYGSDRRTGNDAQRRFQDILNGIAVGL